MPAVLVPITCDVNEALVINSIITSDGTSKGTPLNITGWTMVLVIHRTLGDGVPLKTYTPSVPVGTDGFNTTPIPNSDIVALGPGDFWYYIARIDLGFERNLDKGPFSILPV